ncbi:sialate O-acetylesterase [Hymenobacter sp. BRD67]|uniref:sialate O-acetylesterase n=1 Tax=Hymenobacter sp. BRD67 TaxID=2675877 RepID=UPI00156717C2|nr:sialate O-acetylesterase [Hymenobacter sp. BRD67]QKG52223.1 sialate O-acetylesterase [Hymenobacter sp. BRD67]
MFRNKLAAIVCLTGLALSAAHATVRLPALVSSHMVLQRNQPLPLWGWAAPGEAVSVSFLGKTYRATAPDTTGRWQVTLPAMPAGGPYTITVKGQNTLELTDVLLGDVWLASGQSNMQFKVKDSNPNGYQPVQQADQEIAAATWPRIRFFTVSPAVAYQPQADVSGSGWQVCSPATVAQFSAVSYFFARNLWQRYQVPVGVVVSSWGGTPAEAWTSAEGLRHFPEFEARVADFMHKTADIHTDSSLPGGPQMQPTALYNGMIAPLQPLALTGVIWYQGESNVERAEQYRTLFPALIADWRQHWGTELPFLFVQLANWRPTQPQPSESDWAELREAQALALRLPRTGMATTIDIGDAADIHPHNKQEVGRRLALAARHVVYGDAKVVSSGPTYVGMTTAGPAVRLKFAHTGAGLLAKGGPALQGFAVAGADHIFYWATARLAGTEVVVQSSQVAAPVAVRYDWADNPTGNLYNTEGLPAVPFRTDTWPGITSGKK